jgi:tungstate transport system permease protein
MDYILEGLETAFRLIISFDREVFSIAFISIKVSTYAIIFAIFLGLPFGFFIGIKNFFGKNIIITIFNTLMSIPTVLIGLLVYSFISRRGPLGDFGLLYTPWAMVIGQTILAFPIITGLSICVFSQIDKRIEKTALTLGANGLQSIFFIFSEAWPLILGSILAGFSRIFAEVGVSMMLGGNIRGLTRNITTAIAFETGKGEFSLGIALGIILLIVALFINIFFYSLQNKRILRWNNRLF